MRAQPRRGLMRCMTLIAVTLVVAAPVAQSRADRIDTATRATRALYEQWLGRVPSPSASPVIHSSWPSSPQTMDVESSVALDLARRYWTTQPPAPVMDGAARYLQARATARMFDAQFGRAGSSVEAVHLFGGAYARAYPQLRFDGPAAGLDRDTPLTPAARAALVFASLERVIGAPRLLGGLRSLIDRHPASDADAIAALNEALGQDLGWLFESVVDPSRTMNYRVADVRTDACTPAPCQRVSVDVAHEGAASFRWLVVRVDFSDGQSASIEWDGREPSRTFTFEGASRPSRVRVDPGLQNLLDDNLLDQSRELESVTNAPIAKWIARWTVWLQDAMLTYSAMV